MKDPPNIFGKFFSRLRTFRGGPIRFPAKQGTQKSQSENKQDKLELSCIINRKFSFDSQCKKSLK